MIDQSHPVLKLIQPYLIPYLNRGSYPQTHPSTLTFDNIPYKTKLIKWPKMTSKLIRNAGIRTTDQWSWKRQFYQVSHCCCLILSRNLYIRIKTTFKKIGPEPINVKCCINLCYDNFNI